MKALILINPQIDFTAGGALEITGATELLQAVAEQSKYFEKIVCVKEWHPADHICFAANHPWRYPGQEITFHGKQIKLMLTHCVQDQFGAMVHPTCKSLNFDIELELGSDQFQESDQNISTIFQKELAPFFMEHTIKEVKTVGLVHNEIDKYLGELLSNFFPKINLLTPEVLKYLHPTKK